jgi:hypothetical protein
LFFCGGLSQWRMIDVRQWWAVEAFGILDQKAPSNFATPWQTFATRCDGEGRGLMFGVEGRCREVSSAIRREILGAREPL